MNIFVLDTDPKQAASYLRGSVKHHCKMTVESCQLLSTTIRLLYGEPGEQIWKGEPREYSYMLPNDTYVQRCRINLVTHRNHPCAIWVRQSFDNWAWLHAYASQLAEWYIPKHGREFKCAATLRDLWEFSPQLQADLPSGLTEFPQAMDEQYRIPEKPAEAYLGYMLATKSHLLHCLATR